MESGIKIIFRLRFNDNIISKKFDPTQNLKTVIAKAKELFSWPDEEIYTIFIDRKEQDEELILNNLPLQKGQSLDLVKKIALPNDLVTFTVSKDHKDFKCSGSLSSPLGEALRKFFNSEDFNLSHYQLQINRKEIEETKILSDIENIKDIVVDLVRKKNSVASDSEDQADQEDQIEEKEIIFTVNCDEIPILKHLVNWLDTVKSLKVQVAEKLSIPTECLQVWLVNEKELDDSQPLNKQITSPEIQVEIRHLIPVQIDLKGEKIDKTLAINLNISIKILKIKFESEIQMLGGDQAWYLENMEEQMRDNAKLCEYIGNDCSQKPKILIKKHLNQRLFHEKLKAMKTYFFQYQNLPVTRDFSSDESIATVLTNLKQLFNLKPDAQVQCKYGQVIMDSSKHLSDFMEEPDDVIFLEDIENEDCSLKVNFIFQRRPFCIITKSSALVEEIKQQACKMKSIEHPHLYSLKLKNTLLKLSHPLKSISDFKEGSVLELCAEIEINFNFLKNQQSESFSLCIDPNIKIEDLKKRIEASQLIIYQEFDLVLNSQCLDENKPLSQYLEREDSWVITIEEKPVKKSSFQIIFNKIPENQVYPVSVSDEVFHNLTSLLSKEFKIDSSLQVWNHEGKMIFDQQGWSDFLSRFKDVNEVKFDVFECVRPFEQTVFFNRIQQKNSSKEKVKLNLSELVSALKKEVAGIWQLQENQVQAWKVNSKDVRDDLPLAVQYDVFEREDVDVVISTPRELILILDGVESHKSLDGDATISDLKKHLFEVKIIGIKPESQVWSLENNQGSALEDDKELSFYLDQNQSKKIVVKKKVQLIRLQYHKITTNQLESLEIEGDIEAEVKALKNIVLKKLGLKPRVQFWMLGDREMLDNTPLKEYVSQDELHLATIDIYPFKDFTLNIVEFNATIKITLPVIASVNKIIEIMIENYPAYKNDKIFLQAYDTTLDKNKSLQDYPNIWASNSMPIIRAMKARKLSITFKEAQEDFYFGSQTTIQSLESEICQRFSIQQNHEFYFLENGKHFSKQDLLQQFKNGEDKTLTVRKTKKCIFIFEDLPENKEEVFKRNSEVYLDEIEEEIKKQLQIPNQNLRFLYNQQVCTKNPRSTLDDIDADSYELKFTVQMIKELEIQHGNEKYLVEYIPSETIKNIKLKLKEKGFLDVKNFSLQKDDKVLPDRETLNSNGIVYGRHTLVTKMNLQVIVLTDEGEFKEICGDELQTIADLKQKIKEKIEIDITKQILILLEGHQWIRRLIIEEEKLEELTGKEETTIRILCKSMKKFPIAIGLQRNVENFQGILDSSIEEQKKLIEIDYKISVNNQIWTTKKGKKFEPLNEETIEEDLRNDVLNKANPIRIFRKINLSVCLIDKTEVLENLPTYETIKEQKDRIALRIKVLTERQHWSYNEEELQDVNTLEECFLQRFDAKNAPESESFALDLIILTDLEYFGFTDKKDINVDLFKNFFLESDEDLNRVVASVSFNRKDDSFHFRNQVLGLFFGTLKKHSLWEGLISRIKKKMFDIKAVNLWANNEKKAADQSKFNTQFLLYYFLNSGSPELNIEILKIMKMHFPVPLAIKTWSNRFSVEDNKIVDDLYWIVQKGFFIASFGYGGAENSACGKTLLTNKLVSSNFVSDSERNSICRGCPEILFDIYKNDKFPINLIDIPSGTHEKIKEKILSCANMLIIHSLAEEEKTREFLRQRQINIPTIVLYRDVQDAFYNITKFKDSLIEEFNKALKTDIFEVKITDYPNYKNSNELDHLAEKIHEFILENFKRLGGKNKELWKFLKFFGNHNNQVDELFDRVREKSSQIVKVVPIFNTLKVQERKKNKEVSADQKKSQEESKISEQPSLSLELEEFLQLLKSNDPSSQEETSHLFLEKFQDYLRMMKNQQTLDFYKLYEFKSKLSKPEGVNEKVIMEFAEYWNKVKNQETYYRNNHFDIATAKTKGYDFIKECISIFERDIIPNIFSIELFWRELIYHDSLQRSIGQTEIENLKVRSQSAFSSDFLVSLKKEDILKGFPFEIIDGDLLHMPKEFLKSVFKGMKDRVSVISVLGPQSSGKSTLLNFLFGCNFVTSSGRCTKGVYGTYFKVSNINSCDGILVLDTEGLFGLLNKNEEQQRDKFDRRLVLFCLAMSDIVLVNFKGDIDRTLTQVMMVCKDSLKNLQQGNIQIPEMFLILNQNSQTNRETQLQDIDKMRDLGFSSENVKILPLAFDTKKEKISTIEKYMDLATKKTPKEDFSEQCRLIAQELFEKMSSNGNKNVQRTLESTMDTMEHLWELLDKFPDLLRHSNLQDQDQEKKIKEWIEKEVDENLKKRLSEIANNLKNSDKIKLNWEKDFHEKFTEEEKLIKYNFGEEFKEQTDRHLFEDLESVLYTHIDRIRIELENELNIRSHHEKIKVYDTQGIEMIREAAYQLRNKDNLTDVEQETYFEEAWQKHIAKSENFYNRDKESENLFQTVVENYKTNLHQITGCLPSSQFPKRDNILFKDYQQALQRILDQIYRTEKRFEYTKQRPALIFKGGKGNISFKYLDLRQYFEKTQLNENMGIHRSKIFNIFDIEKIKERSSQSPAFQDQKRIAAEYILRELAMELDQCGIWISQQILESYLMYEQQWRVAQWFTSPFKDSDLTSSAFSFRTSNQYSLLPKYVDPDKIERKKKEIYKSAATNKSFISYVLRDCIKWKEIKDVLLNEIKETYKTVQNSSLVAEIEAELAKIHLEFRGLSHYISFICYSDEKSIKEIMRDHVFLNQGSLNENSLKDINSVSFNYLKKDVIQKHLQKVESNSPDYLIIQRLKGEKWVAKREFGNVPWLVSYAKEDLGAIFQNTMEDGTLRSFISQQFKFRELIQDIFAICASKIQSIDNYSSIQLYQQIARETNDLIGMANNDLQQVSYRLDFKLVGEIHLQMVHLIWKYFEERHWEKITQPLEDMKNRKEQQKGFFKLVASSDDRQINKAEAEKIGIYAEEYAKGRVQALKEEIIKSSVESFKKQTKRRKIQDQLDSKYFSRNAVADNDDLYFYILNPREAILKAYEDTSDQFCRDLENQIQGESKSLNDLLGEFLARIIQVQSVLNCYDEDFWALHHIFEFKKVQILSKDEVLVKKYHSEIAEVYYRITLAFLQGNANNIFKEYEIASELKVVLKKIESIQISPLENKDVLKIIKNLESQPGNTTNARLFIESLLREVEALKKKSDKFFHFSLEDLKEFRDKSNAFVCKQKCPCCDRICGEEDPIHKTHRCLYGHQIRAIGGTMIETKEASIARCEDISDIDKMKYNGRDMTWAEFKEERKNDPNNPWSFDDVISTRSGDFLREKFELAWTLIGKRICEVKHKGSEMKFVPFNKATIDAQKMKFSKPSNYIFMIDSSASMKGDRWTDLKKSLKETLGKISTMNKNNKVSIVNFSSDTQIPYENTPANSISVDVLHFIGHSTNFSKAFASGFELLKKVKQENIVFIFMTDGETGYPTKEINDIKGYLNSPGFTNLNIKFSFNGIGFKFKTRSNSANNISLKSRGCNQAPETVLERLVKDLGGTPYFADTGADLTRAYTEILNKKDN